MEPESMSRIISQNIRAGGGKRIRPLLDRIAAYEPDIIVLTEFRLGNIAHLSEALDDHGFTHRYHFAPASRMNGTLVASRNAVDVEDVSPVGDRCVSNHLLRVQLNCFDVIAAYIPQHKNIDTKAYFDTLAWLASSGDVIIAGDLNTGDPDFDGYGYKFTYRHWYADLLATGLVDCYRRDHGEPTVTWKHPRGSREGFRIDHALASPSVAARVRRVGYDHSIRLEGLSDHSALLIDIA